MIKRFMKVNDNLYRGGAPSVDDVVNLQKHFGIKKIISLDEGAGKRINRICQLLHIEHIILPINPDKIEDLISLFDKDLKSLLMDNGPTFVHCIEGKDRTGLIIAMFKCRYMGVPCNVALKEAKKFGFGVGLPPRTIRYYEKAIQMYCKDKHDHNKANLLHIDNNSADVVDNSRPGDDFMGSVLDSADISSFAPYLDVSRQYPGSEVYNYKSDQSQTRNNFGLDDTVHSNEKHDIALVGLYDNDAGVHGVGPVEPGGSFTEV